MKRIGEDVAEKLDYEPGVFTRRAPRARQVGLRAAARSWCRRRWRRTSSTRASRPPACWPRCWWPSTWITCRCTGRKRIFERAGLAIARSTLAQWVGECGVQLQPLVDALGGRAAAPRRAARRRDAGGDAQAGQRQDAPGLPVELLHDAASTRRRRSCSTSPTAAAAQHVRDFLGCRAASTAWKGKLVTDDFSGYKACFELRRDRGRLHGARAAQVPRAVGQPRQHGRRAGAEVLRHSCTRSSAKCASLTADERQTNTAATSHAESPMRCTSGCCSSGRRCPTGRPRPRRSTTA